jgi:hypothetical protein
MKIVAKLSQLSITVGQNEQEYFFLGGFSSLVYCLQVRPEPDLGSKVLSGIDACIAPLSLSA